MSKRAPKQPWRPRFGWLVAIALAGSMMIATAGCATLETQVFGTRALTEQQELAPDPTPYGFTDESAPDAETVIAPGEPGTVAIADSSVTRTTALALLATLPIKGKRD